ncbi:MAG TPA: rod shape-determining protein MreC [Acidobacteriaceae bacterium]|jgi:rod shape-determining protein MreC|nr:rod shape-determining protein MreC [Acidobacteriaceae bacterium]
MESFFSRYRNALVLIAVLVAQVIGLAVQVRVPAPSPVDKGGVRLIRSWVVGIVAPPERLLRATGGGIRGLWTDYIDLIHVRQQNKALKAQLDSVRLEEESLAEDARQGQRLQTLLGFQEKYVYKTVAAQVIGTSGTEQSHVLLIDKGMDDGIRPDMPVITPDGIVGKTRDVFGHTSQVLEISDQTSGAGVILEKTRIRGVLRGNSWGQPEIVNVSPDERIQHGEPVLTSGGDAIYPRGLSVGTVDRIVPDPDGTLVSVLIQPAANLSRLEEVLVITTTGDQMPAQMQQDLSDAEQKASDILAERLPSRTDPNAPPAGQQTGNPQSQPADTGPPAMPAPPLQPLHNDRFSPGDVPPASDLVPGQRLGNLPSPPPETHPEQDETPHTQIPHATAPHTGTQQTGNAGQSQDSTAPPAPKPKPTNTQPKAPAQQNPEQKPPSSPKPSAPPSSAPPSSAPPPQGGA